MPNAAGSVLCCFGNTRVICTVTIEEGVPRWMKEQKVQGGWITAEYSMLPDSTRTSENARYLPRQARRTQFGDSAAHRAFVARGGGPQHCSGRAHLWIDCDVLQADGGTRTASITGACVAAAIAFRQLVEAKQISTCR